MQNIQTTNMKFSKENLMLYKICIHMYSQRYMLVYKTENLDENEYKREDEVTIKILVRFLSK